MQAARSHATTTCGAFACTNCNHGFSISQPQGDRDSANCLALVRCRIRVSFCRDFRLSYGFVYSFVFASWCSRLRKSCGAMESRLGEAFFRESVPSGKFPLELLGHSSLQSKLHRNKNLRFGWHCGCLWIFLSFFFKGGLNVHVVLRMI